MKKSLHSQYPSRVGYISLLFLIGNAALQIYSHIGLSAVIKSNRFPSNDVTNATEPTEPPTDVTPVQKCMSAEDMKWWNETGVENYSNYLGACGTFALFSEAQFLDCVTTQEGFEATSTCAECFYVPARCGIEKCASFCILGGRNNPECVKCANEQCGPLFENCSGLSLSGLPPPIDEGPNCSDEEMEKWYKEDGPNKINAKYIECVDSNSCTNTSPGLAGSWLEYDDTECTNCFNSWENCTVENCESSCVDSPNADLCANCTIESNCQQDLATCTNFVTIVEPIVLVDVYNISFISSVQDALEGEAYGIALVIIIFSGIWPYGKNLIMLCAWFIPMTPTTRSSVLKNLTRLAKWSLVDVFAIVIIIAGVRIDKDIQPGEPLLVIAESRIAIYTFCVAAIWDLVQGEWMRLMHLKTLSNDEVKSGTIVATREISGKPMLAQVAFRDQSVCSRCGIAFSALFMLLQIGLAIASGVLIVIYFEIGGLASHLRGENNYSYTPWSIATSLVSPERLEFNESIPGTVFLIVCYLLMSIIVPLFEYIAITLVLYLGSDRLCCGNGKIFKGLCMTIDIVGGFASMDVFVLSFVVVTAEWDKLIQKAVGDQAAALCPPNAEEACLEMKSDIGIGIYVMAVAVVMSWIMELIFTFAFAQLYHPEEQLNFSSSVIRSIFRSTGITKWKELPNTQSKHDSVSETVVS